MGPSARTWLVWLCMGLVVPSQAQFEMWEGRRVVIVGPSLEVQEKDFSQVITPRDIIVRPNLKVVDGQVWIPEVVAKHTTNRTDVVCHHGAHPNTLGWFKKKLRPEDAFSKHTTAGYAYSGVKEVIIAEGQRCAQAIKLSRPGLPVQCLQPKTLKWCRSIQKPVHYAAAYSTAFRCLKDILARPISGLLLVGMDFHKGGTQLSYFQGYNELAVPNGMDQSKITVKMQSGGWHNFTREFEVFRDMVKTDNRIKITPYFASLLFPNGNTPEGSVVGDAPVVGATPSVGIPQVRVAGFEQAAQFGR
mmetsp:Transcript_35656/g.77824  ORF Transcript_35656/g.77824 Transcript_35656/m.77824 type:complete len:303 (+) Transcript_35656:116-1024(+)|eukprot:CAMPEP_0118933974 /NCGR_PEP_ID=MMETSP1169-20130426/13178_1 /TAXON_ID=36882 /ORGANISM="Pyramimonas obovata, Strain CCMP722" /LENGTH=302 /DNA_ID=CAMNT_0006876825 /DNA_START=108 /DNA_END=1016 /DNA_ORIENTATION=+